MTASVTADTVATWIGIAVIVGAAWIFSRGGGGTAISSLQAANRVLVARVDALEREGVEKDRLIAELQGKTDVTVAVQAAIRPLMERSDNYERRAEERHLLALSMYQLIADQIGADRRLSPET